MNRSRSTCEEFAHQHGTASGLILPVLAAAALLLQAPVPVAAQSSGSDGEVTFSRDVAPILQENCQVCHQPGSIAPMSFMSYEEVRPWAPMIEYQVVERNMPPYHYSPNVGIQELRDDKRLSEEEIRTIVRWVEAGAPEGDPADLPAPVEWPDANEWRLAADLGGPPDHVVGSVPYTVPAEGPDFWFRPELDTGLTEDRCIKAVEVKPTAGGRAVVHHAIPSLRVQDEDGEWGRGGTLTEYALGKRGELLPEDACRLAPANSRLTWEIHYSPQGEVVEDNEVEVGLWFHETEEEPDYRQALSLFFLERQGGGPVIDLPPHGTNMTQGFHSWDHPVRIDSFMPHGHYRLRAKWMEIYHPSTGEREMISMVPNFHPGWQNAYTYEPHAAPLIPAGSVMILTAFYDNTADNPHNPDPDQWVMRGARTTDEMSHAWIGVTHLDEEGYEELLAERETMEEEGDASRELAGDE